VDLDDPARVVAGELVEAVDVLCDEGVELAPPFQLEQGPVAGVGLGGPRRRRHPVPPGGLADFGIAHIVRQVGRLLGLGVLGPHPIGTPEVRDATVGGDARPGEHGDGGGGVDPSPGAGDVGFELGLHP
jgi:hypothetical protein